MILQAIAELDRWLSRQNPAYRPVSQLKTLLPTDILWAAFYEGDTMINNYHTHTYRCLHAEGTEDEYAKVAFEKGLKVLGFSDHTPHFFPGDYYSYMRMRPEELDGYCKGVNALRQAYAGQMEIHLGLEVEYYPVSIPKLLPVLRDAGIEYLILGQHWAGNEYDAPHCGRRTESVELLKRYCDQCIEAMHTGIFSYFAHPELIKFLIDKDLLLKHLEPLCQASIDTDTPLEINLLGIAQGRHYPVEEFWQLAGQYGCTVILGSDAHAPDEVVRPEAEAVAMEYVQKYNLNLIETLPFKKF